MEVLAAREATFVLTCGLVPQSGQKIGRLLDVVHVVAECLAAGNERTNEAIVREELAIDEHVKEGDQVGELESRLERTLI